MRIKRKSVGPANMLSRDYRDIVGGLLLTVVGAAFSWYAVQNYELGTLQRMGPGMFPMSLGFMLAVFGLALLIPAFFRPGVKPQVRIWSPLFVLSGVAAFAATIPHLGLIPAVLAIVIISSFAELKIRLVTLSILSVSLCLIAWITFRVALGLPIPIFRWPF